jgi:hypothetical protein
VFFAISVINKRVNIYNYLSEKNEYADFSKFIIFDKETLYNRFRDASEAEKDAIATEIQAVYNLLYSDSSNYFSTKHYLLSLSLDSLNTNGSLLNNTDMKVLKNYTLKIKSSTQYPHFEAYLGLEADASLYTQDQSPFNFKLTTAEATFAIDQYRTLYTGPDSVISIAQTANGAWAIIPLIMDNGFTMDQGLNMDMTIGDIPNYLTSFQLGKDNYETLNPSLINLKDSFFSSENVTIIYDEDFYYLTLTVNENEGNDYPIKEVGIYNNNGFLAFYIKHPEIYKTSSHKLFYRIKLKVNGLLP